MLEGRDDLTPPGETEIHTAIYRARPEINCVIHVHPATVVLFTIVGRASLFATSGNTKTGSVECSTRPSLESKN